MSSARRPRVPPRQLIVLSLAALLAACAREPQPEPDRAGAACGNGIVETGEECDDGNTSNADGCLTSCYAPARFVSSDPHLHGRGCLFPPTPSASLAQMLSVEGIEVG